MVEEIKNIDLSEYEEQLTNLLRIGVEAAIKSECPAVYFEYDMDNSWDGALFVCTRYCKLKEDDEDWACDYLASYDGPRLDLFGDLYETGFDCYCPEDESEREDGLNDEYVIGKNLYLVARTTAAFGRAVSRVDTQGLAVCIGFHDQSDITRIRELK